MDGVKTIYLHLGSVRSCEMKNKLSVIVRRPVWSNLCGRITFHFWVGSPLQQHGSRRISVLPPACYVPRHFNFGTHRALWMTLIRLRISSIMIWLHRDTLSITLSITRWVSFHRKRSVGRPPDPGPRPGGLTIFRDRSWSCLQEACLQQWACIGTNKRTDFLHQTLWSNLYFLLADRRLISCGA